LQQLKVKEKVMQTSLRHTFRDLCVLGIFASFGCTAAMAQNCSELPDHETLTAVLEAVAPDAATNGGLDTNMWATIVNRDGQVCAVAMSGADRDDQWPGSRVISAQKANTANAFSLDIGTFTGSGLALSTANLYSAVQPGGSLFGLQHSNPVDAAVAYGSPAHSATRNDPPGLSRVARRYGTEKDPLVGQFIGGVNVFGGGLALYDTNNDLIGALGVSGDTSCADHNVAWRVRDGLGLDYVPAGVSGNNDDNIIFDTTVDAATGHTTSLGGFGHPSCGFGETAANSVIVGACPVGDGTSANCDAL
jgi:uncharacterized protein GlcG (DUF336 family)